MFDRHDITRNECMLEGSFGLQGYDWWWHSFTAINEKTGEERPFFIEFFVCNNRLAEDMPTFGQLPENKKAGKKPSYLMVKAGAWCKDDRAQLHRFFAWKDVRLQAKAPFSVTADDCLCSETKLKGSINISPEEAKAHPEWMCDSGSMSWNITVEKQIAFNVGYGASKPFRKIKAFEMYWHAEGMKSAYSGVITYNGQKYIVESNRSYGYADKNWGRGFTSPWVWLSSCCLKSRTTGKMLENSVFDIGGGRPKIGFIALDRKLLSAFYYEGKQIEFNFSKPHTNFKTVFNCYETESQVVWHVEQSNFTYKMVTDVTCEKKDMLLVNYEAPNGEKRHNRLWNGGNGVGTVKLYRHGNLVDEIEATHIGCEYGEYDKA